MLKKTFIITLQSENRNRKITFTYKENKYNKLETY